MRRPAEGRARTTVARSVRSVRPVVRRWSTAQERPRSDDEAAELFGAIEASQPGFRAAVRADAEITARFRGEHHEFSSGLDALIQAIRLCWVTDSFFAQVCYRARVRLRTAGVPLVPRLLHRLSITHGQLSIGDLAVLEAGIYMPHGQVVIDGLVIVRSGAVLRPFVTLGLRDGHVVGPTIGPHARIGTGAKVVGPVSVGDRAQVGANAVVVDDVPADTTVVGVPARLRS